MSAPPEDRVLVFDFGAQYAQLIARRVREQNVFCHLVRHDLSADRVRELAPRGIILSGGPASVYEPNAPKCDPRLFDLNVPVLGVCYGMQLVCEAMGGLVRPPPAREFGRAELTVTKAGADLFHDVPPQTTVWMSHGDQVHDAGPDFEPLAVTATCPVAAVRHHSRPVYGIQFHPEVGHTPYGTMILGNFLDRVCGNPKSWTMEAFIGRSVEDVRRRVGPTDRVVCGL